MLFCVVQKKIVLRIRDLISLKFISIVNSASTD